MSLIGRPKKGFNVIAYNAQKERALAKSGNIKTTDQEIAQAKFQKYASKKRRKPKNRSIRTISGGLPSLGKRSK